MRTTKGCLFWLQKNQFLRLFLRIRTWKPSVGIWMSSAGTIVRFVGIAMTPERKAEPLSSKQENVQSHWLATKNAKNRYDSLSRYPPKMLRTTRLMHFNDTCYKFKHSAVRCCNVMQHEIFIPLHIFPYPNEGLIALAKRFVPVTGSNSHLKPKFARWFGNLVSKIVKIGSLCRCLSLTISRASKTSQARGEIFFHFWMVDQASTHCSR